MISVIYVQKIDRREIRVEPISLTWQRLESDQSNVQIFIDIDRQSSVSIKRVASTRNFEGTPISIDSNGSQFSKRLRNG